MTLDGELSEIIFPSRAWHNRLACPLRFIYLSVHLSENCELHGSESQPQFRNMRRKKPLGVRKKRSRWNKNSLHAAGFILEAWMTIMRIYMLVRLPVVMSL